MTRDQLLQDYLHRGWAILPLAPRTKRPYADDWSERTFSAEDFRSDDNIGLKLGGFADLDLDCLEAVLVAPKFLPASLTWGRPSKPRSHWLYQMSDPTGKAWKVDDPDSPGHPIVEVRTGNNHQSMLPPSTWSDKNGEKSDEEVTWTPGERLLAEISFETAKRRATLLAASAYLLRHYPDPGTRHEHGLSLCGCLRQLGVLEEEARWIVEAAGEQAEDHDMGNRLAECRSTYQLDAQEAAMRGYKHLRELSKQLAEGLRKILGGVFKRGDFLVSGSGSVIRDAAHNIQVAFDKEEVEVQFNVLTRRSELVTPDGIAQLSDLEINALWFHLERRYGFRPPKDLFYDFLNNQAFANSYNPVLDYLRGLPAWDQTPRVEQWLTTYLGAEDTPFNRGAGAKVLLAACQRAIIPGTKFDQLLVLESRQGSGKSTSIAALCPDPKWFTDNLPMGADPQKVIEQTRGKWICEISELYGLSQKAIENVKAFLSRTVDEARKSYGREPEARPRGFICIGTTNREQYLSDPTGNRRFWPVRVGDRQDVDGLARDRDQLWAEVWSRREESVVLSEDLWDEAEKQQAARDEVGSDPWLDVLRSQIPAPRFPKGGHGLTCIMVSKEETWTYIGIPPERRDRQAQLRVNACMKRLRFTEKPFRRRPEPTQRGWVRTLSAAEVEYFQEHKCLEDMRLETPETPEY